MKKEKKAKKTTKKVFNPLTGKYLSLGDNLVLALIIKQAPLLVDMWKSSGSDLLFHEYLLNFESNTPIKGVVNKFIAKRYCGVVEMLVALWEKSDFETFDIFMEYHHTRAGCTPQNK